MSRLTRWCWLICMALLVGGTHPASAEDGERLYWEPKDNELKALPAYCAIRLRRQPGWDQKLRPVFGEAYIHLHHYCAALNGIVKANRSKTPEEERGNLQEALGQLEYVESAKLEKNSLILPELYYLKGQVADRLGDRMAAAGYFAKAIRLQPKYAQAYGKLAELYMKQKRNADAKVVIEEGLKRVPDSRPLKKLFGRLDTATGAP